MWVIWPLGAVILVAAGFAAVYLPRRRAREHTRRAALADARAAIDMATVSRDATQVPVPEAERLLARAETIVAGRGGRSAARTAAAQARRADELWRAAR